MSMLILVKRAWSFKEYRKSLESPGRKIGKPHGSYIDDLAALKKAIVLCEFCVGKFNAKKNHYYRQREYPSVRGDCDACKQYSGRASLFIHESQVQNCWTTREENILLRRVKRKN